MPSTLCHKYRLDIYRVGSPYDWTKLKQAGFERELKTTANKDKGQQLLNEDPVGGFTCSVNLNSANLDVTLDPAHF